MYLCIYGSINGKRYSNAKISKILHNSEMAYLRNFSSYKNGNFRILPIKAQIKLF